MAVRALTCNKHGFGTKKCVVCGKWPAKNPALLCSSCGFATKREQCCICDAWPARNPALVCDSHKKQCAKCGAHV